jgi:hypothetical protein
MFMSFLNGVGFYKGIAVYDEQTAIMFDAYRYLMQVYPFHGLTVMMLLLEAGYCSDDIKEYVTKRIDRIHRVAVAQLFDIYEDDVTKIRQPNKWSDKLILKDRHTENLGGEFPLPTVYDVMLFMRFYRHIKDDSVKQQVNDIMDYIRHPEYQKTGGDYGWHWAQKEKTYHASSGGWGLPMYGDDEYEPKSAWGFLSKLETMSYSPVMLNSEYFKKCINYLDGFKTERGTYILHSGFISRRGTIGADLELVVSQDVLPLIKKNDRRLFLHELRTTCFMAVMKYRMKCSNQAFSAI